jgi:hypothetical protein
MRILLSILLSCIAASGAVRNYVIGYGQSLSLGNQGCPAISITQPYSNQRLNTGQTAFVALIEDGTCVTNGALTQESPNSAAANNLTLLDPAHAYASTWNNYGVAGTALSGLAKGSGPYTVVLNGVTAAKNVATAAGDTLVVRGVFFTHGEQDFANASIGYKAAMAQFQSDLEADIKAITGQSSGVPVYLSQMSAAMSGAISCTPGTAGTACGTVYVCPDGSAACIDDYTGTTSPMVTIAQWQLYRDYPGRFYLTGPKYQVTYADAAYHLTAVGYNLVGAAGARGIEQNVVGGGRQITALTPSTITLSGSTITLTLHSPQSLSVVCDTSTIGAPVRNGVTDTAGCGFQFFQQGSTLTDTHNNGGITGVSCSGQTCTITLSGTTAGTNKRLAYAFEGTRYAASGGASATQGGMHTVADYVDLHGDTVYHWLVHFNEPVGFAWDPYAPNPSGIRGSAGIRGGIR